MSRRELSESQKRVAGGNVNSMRKKGKEGRNRRHFRHFKLDKKEGGELVISESVPWGYEKAQRKGGGSSFPQIREEEEKKAKKRGCPATSRRGKSVEERGGKEKKGERPHSQSRSQCRWRNEGGNR